MALPNKKNVARFLAESNAIEGIEAEYLPYYEGLLGAEGPNLHVSNTVAAWHYVMAHRKEAPRQGDILELHRLQMTGLMPEDEVGHWRTGQVLVGGSVPPRASVLHFSIHRFVEAMADLSQDSFKLHAMYERAHPFWDGNGRTGRLLWAWARIQRGEKIIPILDAFDDEKSLGVFKLKRLNYYKWLQRCDEHGNG